MSWSPEESRDLLLRCADRMEAAAAELNELDGRLGDGDLGATLEKCVIRTRTGLDGEFSTPSDVFKAGAMACARASGSSFDTLRSVAFMALTKETAGKSKLEAADIWPLLATALTAFMGRGQSNLGNKTAFDSLEAVRAALAEQSEAFELCDSAASAAEDALERLKDKPN